MSTPRVAILIVSFEAREELRGCLQSIRDHAALPTDVVVVDNASSDGSPDLVRAEFPEVRLLANPGNHGFAVANNQGLRGTQAPLLLLLNPDARLTAHALPALVQALESRPAVGIVAPRIVDAAGAPEPSFGPPLSLLTEWHQRRRVQGLRRGDPRIRAEVTRLCATEQSPGWVSGACLLARRDILEAVGGFDEAFFLYEEDVDLCVRVTAAGHGILYTPEATIVHAGGQSMRRRPRRAAFEYHRSHLIYYRKHASPASSAVLRASLAVRGAGAWLTARSAEQRAHAGALVRLALGGAA